MLRAAVVVGLTVLAGCGKQSHDRLAPASSEGILPATKVPLGGRDYVNDLYEFYRHPSPFPKHTREGLTVLCQFATDYFGVRDSGGRAAVLYGSLDGSCRPKVVALLADANGFREGPILFAVQHVEGVLRGPVAFAEKPWARLWAGMTPHEGPMADHFVLIDEASVVALPSDSTSSP